MCRIELVLVCVGGRGVLRAVYVPSTVHIEYSHMTLQIIIYLENKYLRMSLYVAETGAPAPSPPAKKKPSVPHVPLQQFQQLLPQNHYIV